MRARSDEEKRFANPRFCRVFGAAGEEVLILIGNESDGRSKTRVFFERMGFVYWVFLFDCIYSPSI